MALSAEGITIAVTVHGRREYLRHAVKSALEQTVPVRVIVVEDCGPDPAIRQSVEEEFGDRIQYFRNPKNRGLFDNWNACLEYCQTPWISILHDDDLLRPDFVETMLALAKEAPESALYFGSSAILTEAGTVLPAAREGGWRVIDPIEFAEQCFVLFPGQMFRVAAAKAVGGFRKRSYFTGDWDMWFRLALRFGGAETAEEVSIVRLHGGFERGTNRVDRMGWKWLLDNVQRKRNLALLRREKGIMIPFDRTKLLERSPIATRMLLKYAHRYSKRVLAYNTFLWTRSTPPHLSYAVLQWLGRLFGPRALKGGSIVWNWLHRPMP